MAYQKHRRRSIIGIAVVALVALVAVFGRGEAEDDRPVILVTGDFGKPGDFCHDVHYGAKLASSTFKPGPGEVAPMVLPLDTVGEPSFEGCRRRFLEAYTTRNVVGIISADISSVATGVVAVANRYQTPVLLTVATNDKVLADRRNDLSFRLVPTDTQQSHVLAEWCRDKHRPAVIHGGQTPYGQFLGRKTVDLLNRQRLSSGRREEPVIVSAYFEQTDFFTVLVPIKAATPDGIVFIGYADRLPELIGKLQVIGWTGPTLLADGCYSPALIQNPPADGLSLSFPTVPTVRANDNIRANGVFGYDAYHLLTKALNEDRNEIAGKGDIGAGVRRIADSEAMKQLLLEKYRFDAAGENELAGFQIFPIPSSQSVRGAP